METPVRTMFIFGTRPEAIKLAPVIQHMAGDARFAPLTVATGQHEEMLEQALGTFGIVPDVNLRIMEHGQSLTDVTVRTLTGLQPLLARFRPEIVLVHGDTLASFAAALASFFEQVPVAHVEAGLRTFHRYDPFPEEMSRRLTARLASLHFAPTARAKENLLREGVPAEEIFVVGNTVIDALLSQVDPGFTFADPLLRDIDFARERVLLVTAHRRENWGAPLERIYRALVQVAEIYPDVRIVVALHKNPLIRRAARDILSGRSRIHLIEPPAYRSFVNLMARCTLILTDSGGIQEEAPALGKPVLVLRETTERPEGLEAGTCLKVGTGTERIVGAVRRLLDDAAAYEQMRRAVNPYGDGQAARRIVEILWAKLRQGGDARDLEWTAGRPSS